MKWGTIIPLLGGMTIGCKNVFGCDPSFFLSYPAFADNDAHIRKRFPKTPYLMANDSSDYDFGEVDVVNSVCPCAGLSFLNTGGKINTDVKRGGDAKQNNWMYESTEFVLKNIKPKVLFGENAPGLYTSMGEIVRENLITISKQYGYSFSMIKTNTKLHGIPQNRLRSFFFFWRDTNSPILNWHDRGDTDIKKFLTHSTENQYHNVEERKNKLEHNMFFQYILETLGENFRQIFIDEDCNTILSYLIKDNERIEHFLEWLNDKGHSGEKIKKLVLNIQKKIKRGANFWDSSPYILHNITPAVISRNLCMIHPVENRFLTDFEYMKLMGLPEDFELANNNFVHITQNVPVTTTEDWAQEVQNYINEKLLISNKTVLKQNNLNQSYDTKNVNDTYDACEFIASC